MIGGDRLPLWTVTFWKDVVAKVVEAEHKMVRSDVFFRAGGEVKKTFTDLFWA